MNLSLYRKIVAFRNNPIKLFVRLPHKLSSKADNERKVSAEVVNFLENNAEYSSLKDKIPKMLLRKYKTPESMYLINKTTAKHIAATIKEYLKPNSDIVEVNPGFCILTEELLKIHKGKIYLYESSIYFNKFLEDTNKKYSQNVVTKIGDFFGIAKLAFQDKMDEGTRVRDLLGHFATDDKNKILQIVGAMPGLYFMKYLLMLILFHNSTYFMGRADLYIVMPGHQYRFLTDSQIQNRKNRTIPALFQLLFDYKLLSKVPKLHYLPWISASAHKNDTVLDEHFMYIVNIKQKDTLPCNAKYLPLLWYFFKPQTQSKSTRVIPMLEQWIPGCGVWLITEQDPPDTNKSLGPTESDAKLPHMTIFTQFGDLNLQQKVTVFKKFISWPEFDQCPFKTTMESNLPKYVTAIESDGKDHRRGTHIDMDEDSDTDDEST